MVVFSVSVTTLHTPVSVTETTNPRLAINCLRTVYTRIMRGLRAAWSSFVTLIYTLIVGRRKGRVERCKKMDAEALVEECTEMTSSDNTCSIDDADTLHDDTVVGLALITPIALSPVEVHIESSVLVPISQTFEDCEMSESTVSGRRNSNVVSHNYSQQVTTEAFSAGCCTDQVDGCQSGVSNNILLDLSGMTHPSSPLPNSHSHEPDHQEKCEERSESASKIPHQLPDIRSAPCPVHHRKDNSPSVIADTVDFSKSNLPDKTKLILLQHCAELDFDISKPTPSDVTRDFSRNGLSSKIASFSSLEDERLSSVHGRRIPLDSCAVTKDPSVLCRRGSQEVEDSVDGLDVNTSTINGFDVFSGEAAEIFEESIHDEIAACQKNGDQDICMPEDTSMEFNQPVTFYQVETEGSLLNQQMLNTSLVKVAILDHKLPEKTHRTPLLRETELALDTSMRSILQEPKPTPLDLSSEFYKSGLSSRTDSFSSLEEAIPLLSPGCEPLSSVFTYKRIPVSDSKKGTCAHIRDDEDNLERASPHNGIEYPQAGYSTSAARRQAIHDKLAKSQQSVLDEFCSTGIYKVPTAKADPAKLKVCSDKGNNDTIIHEKALSESTGDLDVGSENVLTSNAMGDSSEIDPVSADDNQLPLLFEEPTQHLDDMSDYVLQEYFMQFLLDGQAIPSDVPQLEFDEFAGLMHADSSSTTDGTIPEATQENDYSGEHYTDDSINKIIQNLCDDKSPENSASHETNCMQTEALNDLDADVGDSKDVTIIIPGASNYVKMPNISNVYAINNWTLPTENLRTKRGRFMTFGGKIWKLSSPSVEEIVYTGFFYKGPGDCTQCFSCGIVLMDWESGDVPIEEHLKHNSECSFIKHAVSLEKKFLSPSIEAAIHIVRSFNLYDMATIETAIERLDYKGFYSASASELIDEIYEMDEEAEQDDSSVISLYDIPGATCKDLTEEILSKEGLRIIDWDSGITEKIKHNSCEGLEESLESLQETQQVVDEMKDTVERNGQDETDNLRVGFAEFLETRYFYPADEQNPQITIEDVDKNAPSIDVSEDTAEVMTSSTAVIETNQVDEEVEATEAAVLQVSRHRLDSGISSSSRPSSPDATFTDTTEEAHQSSTAHHDEEEDDDSGADSSSVGDFETADDGDDDDNNDDSTPLYRSAKQLEEAQSSLQENLVNLRVANYELRLWSACKVCLINPVSILYIDCRHLVCCQDCSKRLQECPICRKRINNTMNVYLQ